MLGGEKIVHVMSILWYTLEVLGPLQSKSLAEVDAEKSWQRRTSTAEKDVAWGPINCPLLHQLFLGSFPLVQTSFEF